MIANLRGRDRWGSAGYSVRDNLVMRRTLRTPPMHHIVINQVRGRHYQWLNQLMELSAEYKPVILHYLRPVCQGIFFVICLMLITVWTRSWRVSDSFMLMDDNARVYALIGSVDGRMYLDWYTYQDSEKNQRASWTWLTHRSDSRAYAIARNQTLDRGGPLAPYGWRILETKHWSDARSRILCVPYWGFLLPSAIVMIWHGYGRWWLKRLQKRMNDGLCIRCGYDLRSSTEICPCCGEQIVKITTQETHEHQITTSFQPILN